MIKLYHVGKLYGRSSVALDDITFTLEKGEFAFLTGRSGAGKSTLLKLLLVIEQVTRGQILIHERNLNRLRAWEIPSLRRNIGMVFQDFRLLPDRTVAENVALPLKVQGAKAYEIRRKVASVLDMVGLLDRASSFPPELSGGEQQRVAVARALVHDPSILLADEPTGNLDPDHTDSVLDLFVRANVRGTTVLFATHDRHLIGRARRRVLGLSGGKLAFDTDASPGMILPDEQWAGWSRLG